MSIFVRSLFRRAKRSRCTKTTIHATSVITWYKSDAAAELQEGVEKLAAYQDMLYAQNIYALLLVFQALDAAGKDSVIKHVMSGVNPQGCEVYSFKAPSPQERDHDYMWRNFRALPERGRIGIFNRSYYEETIVVRVHPELLEAQQLPPEVKNKHIWQQRFEQINHFEKYQILCRNLYTILPAPARCAPLIQTSCSAVLFVTVACKV